LKTSTVYVRLTCKQKVDRDTKGKNLPAGVVKWYMEMFDADDELVAIATILTLVEKKNPFIEMTDQNLLDAFALLKPDTKARWGIMTPQHMVEHLEYQYQVAMGKIHTRLTTAPERLERYIEVVYNHQPMMRGFNHPILKKGEVETLRFDSLETAVAKYFDAKAAFETYFKENKGLSTLNPTFGALTKYEWDLLNRKHTHHHFQQFGLV